MLLSPPSAAASLGPKLKKSPWQQAQEAPPMAVVRPNRMLTLAFGDMETLRILPQTFAEVEILAREWVQPPPGAAFAMRIPVEYLPWTAARMVQTPYVWLTSEETYQISTQGATMMRIEIVSEAPPPPDVPAIPPPPPVLEMPATFKLELNPGQTVAIDTTITSDDLDMSKTEDGTLVAGGFWGKLDITHDGDIHHMEFSGTRLKDDNLPPDFFADQRVLTKLTVAAKPPIAKFQLVVMSPIVQYCDIALTLAPMWSLGITWPPAESVGDNKVKFFFRVHTGGALEHFESDIVVHSLYYEALPDVSLLDPTTYIAPYNAFGMTVKEFIPHLGKVLADLGLSLQARTNFVSSNISSFNTHRNIAYRFMSPTRLRSAIDISVTAESVVFTRIFLMYRGITDDELSQFSGAGEKEASVFNWREVLEWSEKAKDAKEFRVLETAVMEIS